MKKKRNGFSTIAALFIGVSLLAVSGFVIAPRVQAMYENAKVKELVKKEELLRDIYTVYYTNSDGNLATVPQNIDDLITRAKADGLLFADFDKSNGFGENLEITTDGGLFKIASKLPSGNVYIKGLYKSLANKLETGNVTIGDKEQHVYSLSKNIQKDYSKIALFSLKAQDAGAVTSEGAANALTSTQKATTKWWDYNVQTGSYEVKSWDTASGTWKTDETKLMEGAASSKFYTAANTVEIDATKVEAGSRLYVNTNGQLEQYVAYNGQWKSVASNAADVNVIVVPEIIYSLEPLLNRSGTPLYEAKINSLTNYKGAGTLLMQKYENYWKSSSATSVRQYLTNTITNPASYYLYVATKLSDLPASTTGYAYLMENNDANLKKNNGYIATNTSYEAKNLYPEAIYISPRWRYFVPTVTDLLNKAFTDSREYYVAELDDIFICGGNINGKNWWKNVSNTIFITLGSRNDLPDLSISYPSAKMAYTGLNDGYTNFTGGTKSFIKNNTSLLYVWQYNSANSGYPNKLRDVKLVVYGGDKGVSLELDLTATDSSKIYTMSEQSEMQCIKTSDNRLLNRNPAWNTDFFKDKGISNCFSNYTLSGATNETVFVVTDNGDLYSFGNNNNGVLGLNSTSATVTTPTKVEIGGEKVKKILFNRQWSDNSTSASGIRNVIIETISGKILISGHNIYKSIHPTSGNILYRTFVQYTPPTVLNGENIKKIFFGNKGQIILTESGKLYHDGSAFYGYNSSYTDKQINSYLNNELAQDLFCSFPSMYYGVSHVGNGQLFIIKTTGGFYYYDYSSNTLSKISLPNSEIPKKFSFAIYHSSYQTPTYFVLSTAGNLYGKGYNDPLLSPIGQGSGYANPVTSFQIINQPQFNGNIKDFFVSHSSSYNHGVVLNDNRVFFIPHVTNYVNRIPQQFDMKGKQFARILTSASSSEYSSPFYHKTFIQTTDNTLIAVGGTAPGLTTNGYTSGKTYNSYKTDVNDKYRFSDIDGLAIKNIYFDSSSNYLSGIVETTNGEMLMLNGAYNRTSYGALTYLLTPADRKFIGEL